MEDGPCLYPLHRCKIIHLVRHAQGYHNLAGELDVSAYEDYSLLDASITPTGWEQVKRLRQHITETGILENVELVVVSPMTRTMQTAAGVFGGDKLVNGDGSSPLMADGVGKCPQPAISNSNCPPFLAHELCREHTGVHPCDKRHPISKYTLEFPGVDFSQIETDEDTWWTPDIRETDEDLCNRGLEFVKWLLKRKESEIAVVSHSGFLSHMIRLFGEDCGPVVQQEIRARFDNCALRTVVAADRSGASKLARSYSNYSGGIPSGPSAGSDRKDKIDAAHRQQNR